ncbi:invasion associated locus B family protein [Caenibius tardaugens]|uniref:invasion associated locus B family protein n=1 Tax=Caenibius tardaugens TaxID=169176 RepID=UPI003D1AD257
MLFHTCIPTSCLVDISHDAATLTALRATLARKVKVTADDDAAMSFRILLQGLGAALDWVAALSR